MLRIYCEGIAKILH